MVITYHGLAMVKVSHGDWVAVFNPIGQLGGTKPSRFGADLVLVALAGDPAYNGSAELGFGERQPFVIDGPGAYERSDTFIRGFATPGPEDQINTVFDLLVDGKRLVHLGALAEPNLAATVKEELVPVDILFISLNQKNLPPPAAYQLALELNPQVIIPVNHDDVTLKQFLKEAGAESVKPIDKLIVRGRELAEKEAEVVVLSV